MKFGVLRFPGSCDEVDALEAARRVGDAELIWHGDRDLGGADAIVVPGGFSYGDYLRAGAIARFSPVVAELVEAAGGGLPVLGICNCFQVLCEAGLLPGALTRNAGLRFVCRDQQLTVENTGTFWTDGYEPGAKIVIPVKHGEGCWFADPDTGRNFRLNVASMLARGLTDFGRLPTKPNEPKLPTLLAVRRLCLGVYRGDGDAGLRAAAAHVLGAVHREAHAIYKPDDNAGDRAVAIYRGKHPAAAQASYAVVVYPTDRPGVTGR